MYLTLDNSFTSNFPLRMILELNSLIMLCIMDCLKLYPISIKLASIKNGKSALILTLLNWTLVHRRYLPNNVVMAYSCAAEYTEANRGK